MLPPKSKAWICFTKIDKVSATCKLCSQELKYYGNTSNLKHPNFPKSVEELRKKLNNSYKQ